MIRILILGLKWLEFESWIVQSLKMFFSFRQPKLQWRVQERPGTAQSSNMQFRQNKWPLFVSKEILCKVLSFLPNKSPVRRIARHSLNHLLQSGAKACHQLFGKPGHKGMWTWQATWRRFHGLKWISWDLNYEQGNLVRCVKTCLKKSEIV